MRNIKVYLSDILDCIERIGEYTDDLSYPALKNVILEMLLADQLG